VSGLDQAIVQMELLVDGFGQGTTGAPKPGTAEWFLLRAHALGLSSLRRMQQLDVAKDPAAAERFYRRCSHDFKRLTVPDPVQVVKAPA
jgi:hypothetical protein